ncbi:MAG: hypothetical protein HC913_04705 [Microscillaceae bacterium]|nr:hypothetical protein [Microscillaceae bacterium]
MTGEEGTQLPADQYKKPEAGLAIPGQASRRDKTNLKACLKENRDTIDFIDKWRGSLLPDTHVSNIRKSFLLEINEKPGIRLLVFGRLFLQK